ncbi:hypothetical protein M408DRAFT_16862 [Serendipita vermifera MAFF 305830]|uniref:Major facilitator superfamily (MFS) profile domain-containing protein n=1 Tax=Serendipita vermifera MAFF 305830 TaxID=933852 RepID=A0A0C3B5G2_SERVB|nr:hypothetical protein M408DRAFT_16862 [Serendipita vermifera MAFF 305830]
MFTVAELAMQRPLPPSSSTIFTTNKTIPPVEEVFSSSKDASQIDINRNTSELAPVDGGFGAWSFLLAAFLVENIVWGFPNAFGVFLDAYLKDPEYTSQPNAQLLLPLIGTLTSGIIYCSGPFTYPLIYRYPQHCRKSMWFGALLCWASLFGASYTTNVVNLILFQGVLYAIGGTLLYNPCLLYMSEWFVARRGLANGVISAGTATGGLILPLILPGLLDRFGTSASLRILAIAFAVLLLPVLPFLRGRLPHSRVRGPVARSTTATGHWEWVKYTRIQMLFIVNTLQGFGYFVPVIWLPTFASDLNLSATKSSLTLALLNGASVVSRLVVGQLSDVIDPWLLALATLIGTCLSTFVLWGVLSYSFTGLIAFGLAYGSLAGGWSSIWTGFMRDFPRDDPQVATTIIGYLMLSRGLGNILSTPISTALSRPHPEGFVSAHLGFDVGGGRFENVIVYAGTCFAGAALIAGIAWIVERARLKGLTSA